MQNEIQVGRFNGVLHKLLAMREGAPSPTLATDIFPTICLEHDRPEWLYLAGASRHQGYTSITGVAAQYSSICLYNPAGSAALIVVEGVHIYPSAAVAVREYPMVGYAAALAGWTAVGTRGATDLRLGYGQGVGRIYRVTEVALPLQNAFSQIMGPAVSNQNLVLEHPWVLGPDTGYRITCPTVNTTLTVSFRWRQRPLEPSETR